MLYNVGWHPLLDCLLSESEFPWSGECAALSTHFYICCARSLKVYNCSNCAVVTQYFEIIYLGWNSLFKQEGCRCDYQGTVIWFLVGTSCLPFSKPSLVLGPTCSSVQWLLPACVAGKLRFCGIKLTTCMYLHVLQRFRMHGTVPPPPSAASHLRTALPLLCIFKRMSRLVHMGQFAAIFGK